MLATLSRKRERGSSGRARGNPRLTLIPIGIYRSYPVRRRAPSRGVLMVGPSGGGRRRQPRLPPGLRPRRKAEKKLMRRPRPCLASRDSGGPGTPPWRHYDRCAGSRLDWDWSKAANRRQCLVPGSADLGTCRRPKGSPRERRRWSAGRCEPLRQRLAAARQLMKTLRRPALRPLRPVPEEREERAHPAPTQEQGVRSYAYGRGN
jgi:hypothetical protein